MRKLLVVGLTLGVLLAGTPGSATTPKPDEGRMRELPRPSSRGPWLALGLSFGGLAAGVALIALWGAGRGPEPTLGPPDTEAH